MRDWKSKLNNYPLDWLLEENNPSVRYFTLVDILDKDKNSFEVKEARQKIMKTDIVVKILSKQKEGKFWVNHENFYVSTKYRGTVWSFLVLAELNADGSDYRVQQASGYILNSSQDRKSGSFSTRGNEKKGGTHEQVIPCLTGNMIWALIRFGFLKDQRIQRGINWILQYQRLDDGIATEPKGWPYERYKNCWGTHSCNMGVVKNLKALAEIPEDERTNEINEFIHNASEYLLEHRIYKRSHQKNVIAREEWTQFGFPLMWKIDALEILNILGKLKIKDERMQDAIALVLSKQNQNGKWILEKTFNGRVQVNIEKKGKESKWITLNALRALKLYFT
jgi:hypothetical protein